MMQSPTYKVDGIEVCTTVSPEDRMWPSNNNLERYMSFGRDSVKVLNTAFELEGGKQPESILDFGCGYGRIMRWLRGYYPQADIHGADVLAGGINFCAEEFGAKPHLIQEQFNKLVFPIKYNCIWAGSIYTHIDEKGYNDLTDMLVNHLKPNGILSFSVAGPTVYARIKEKGLPLLGKRPIEYDKERGRALTGQYDDRGFGFLARERTSTADSWGRTITGTDYLFNFLRRKNLRVVLYREQVYGGTQDVICVKQ